MSFFIFKYQFIFWNEYKGFSFYKFSVLHDVLDFSLFIGFFEIRKWKVK